MKKILSLVVLFSLTSFASSTSEQTFNPTLENELITMEKKSWVAWKARDGAFFERFLSDDHVEIHPSGVARKAAVVATVATPHCVVNSYSLDSFKLTVFSEDAALLTYHAEQNTLCSGVAVPSPVWTGSLFIRRSGRWLNAAYQHTQAVVPQRQ